VVCALALAGVALGLIPSSAGAARFVRDPSFGTNGILGLAAPFNAGQYPSRSLKNVTPGPAGTTYALYSQRENAGMGDCEATRLLGRYLPNGSLDLSYGSGGYVRLYAPLGDCQYPTLAVDRQLRPIVTWTTYGPQGAPTSTLAITRLQDNGTPDPAFGVGGVATQGVECARGTYANAFTDPTGRLVLEVGCRLGPEEEGELWLHLMRLQPDGTIDVAFGAGGIASFGFGGEWGFNPPSLTFEANGALLLGLATTYVPGVVGRTGVMRIYPNGVADTRYGEAVAISLARLARAGKMTEQPTDLVPWPGGGLDLVGRTGEEGGFVVALRRDGSLERQFSKDGFRWVEARPEYAVLDRRGRHLFFAYEHTRGLRIFRFEPDGRADTTFARGKANAIGKPLGAWFSELVSTEPYRPLVLFRSNEGLGELWRLKLTPPQPRKR
jgi:hypothetical protein